MENKTKDIIQTIIFIFIIVIILILNLIKKDEEISLSERRKLATFPDITFSNMFSSKFGNDFENYAMDQMVFRDYFRSIKTNFEFNVLNKKDNNKLYVIDNSIYKIEYPLKENLVKDAAMKFNDIKEKYLKNMKTYYAIIPDKSFYLEEELRIYKIRS